MKKIVIIGILLIGLFFQNCKEPKKQEVLNNDNQKNVEQQTIDTTAVINNIEVEKDISTTNKPEKIEEEILKAEETTKPIIKPSKNIDKEVVKPLNEIITPIKKENQVIKNNKEEKVIENKVEPETSIQPEVEKVIEKETEIKTTAEPIIEKPKAETSTNNWLVPAKYQSLKNPTNPTIDLSIGKSLYNKHCKSCHGNEGYGDGPKADEMEGELGDFSTKKFQAQSDGALFYKTTIGREDMPEFTKKMPDDEDRWLIVNYLRTLAE